MKYDLTTEIGVYLLPSGGNIDKVKLVASLGYARSDPYAVYVSFHVGLTESVDWSFSRDLLKEGTKACTGQGDVTIWPDRAVVYGKYRDLVHITLDSPFGKAHFEADARDITSFLEKTYGMVPSGEETGLLDLSNEALAAFLQEEDAS